MPETFDIAGIGNACMDIVAFVDETTLPEFSLPKGICTYIGLETATRLLQRLDAPAFVPGGCAANTAACMSSMGNKTAMLCRVANDGLGDAIERSMSAAQIHFERLPGTDDGSGSTRVFCLTTPDGQRTFAAYYGVGTHIRKHDLHPHIVANTRILHMDGFAFVSRDTHADFLSAAEEARRGGAHVSFSPSDLTVIREYPETVRAYTDACGIYISNDAEAIAVSGTADIAGAVTFFQGLGKTGAVTAGPAGAWVFSPHESFHIPAVRPETDSIDSNGAGDHFTAGFLHGFLEKWPLEKCGRLGVLCATDALTHPGARPLTPLRKYRDRIERG